MRNFWKKVIRKQCRVRGSRILNGLLLIAFLTQATFISITAFQKNLSFLRQFIEERSSDFLGQDLDLEWEDIFIGFNGDLIADSVRIVDRSNRDTLVEFASIQISISWNDWLLNKAIPLDLIYATDGKLFIPSMVSPSGLNEVVLESIDLRIRKEEHTLKIDRLQFEYGSWNVFSTGELTLPRETTQEPIDLKDAYFSQIDQLSQFLQNLPQSKQTQFLSANLNSDASKKTQINLTWLSPHFSLPNFNWKNAILHAEVQTDPTQTVLKSLNAQADYLAIPRQTLSFSKIHLSSVGETHFSPFPLLPKVPAQFAFLSKSIEWKALQLNPLLAKFRLAPGTVYLESLSSFAQSDFHIQTALSYHSGFQLNPSQLTLRPNWDSINDLLTKNFPNTQLPQIQLESPIFRAQIDYDPFLDASDRTLSVNFNTQLNAFTVNKVNFANGEISGQLTSNQINIHSIKAIRNNSEQLNGSYRQNLKTAEFVLLAQGQAYPQTVAAYVGSWWDRIFEPIQVKGPPVQANVRVEGNWKDIQSISGITEAWGTQVQYANAQAEIIDLSVSHFSNEVYLRYLKATDSKGSLEGELYWNLNTDHSYGNPITLSLNSTFAFDNLKGFLPNANLDTLSSSNNPTITLNGTWIPSQNPQGEFSDFQFTLHAATPFSVDRFDFDQLKATGTLQQNSLDIPHFEGILFQGTLSGNAQLENLHDPQSPLSINLILNDADFGTVMKMFNPQKSPTNEVSGNFHFETELSFPRQNWMLGTGEGFFRVNEADLGTIHFFGDLSRLLRSLGLNFSSLNMNSAQGTWLLKPNRIIVPKIIVSGPSLDLDSRGEILLPNYDLNFAVDAFAVKNLFGFVLSPISQNLQFSLSGSINDPQWGFRITPFRWLNLPTSNPR